jgi:glycosyltransferase involved in cell wall biosynthesis
LTLLTLIIPTKDRASTLSETLVEISKCRRISECELIICNDGSTDETQDVIEKFQVQNPELDIRIFNDGHKGVGVQRNRAANIAKGRILLFAADDIRPESTNWISSHIELHSHQTAQHFCVLGRIVWPSSNLLRINETMLAIQGKEGEQFGFADLNSNQYLDWRFFYTSNLSVKKTLVANWLSDGFSDAFSDYGYEDIEFAYRLSFKNSLSLFYTSAATALHFQEITVTDFCNRQLAAGRMAATFTSQHPELLGYLTPKTKFDAGDASVIVHVLNLIEGLKSFALLLEAKSELGSQAWHTDLLHLLFKCHYELGIAENTSFDNQGHLVFAFREIFDTGLRDFSMNVSLRNLGVALDSNNSKRRDGLMLHLFGSKIYIPRRLFLTVMRNSVLRRFGHFIKNRLNGRLS